MILVVICQEIQLRQDCLNREGSRYHQLTHDTRTPSLPDSHCHPK